MTKEEFLSACAEHYKSKYKSLFKKVEPYEQKYGIDLGAFDVEQLKQFIAEAFEIRTIKRVYDIQILIRRYIVACGYSVAEINKLNAKEVYDYKNENILLYKNINEVLNEVAACEYFAEMYMDDTKHPDPDWLLRTKVTIILAWRGLDTTQMMSLTWHDIEGTVNAYTAVNGRDITTAESEILSRWFLKRTRQRDRGVYTYPDTPLVLKSIANPTSILSGLAREMKELNHIEQSKPDSKHYKFDYRSIRMNGNFAYAAEHGEGILGLHSPLTPEDSKLLRLFNIYKKKMK